MEFKAQCVLTPGPSMATPVRLILRNPHPDEDGSRGLVQLDLSVEDARSFAADLQQAARWVESGAWKVGGP